MLKYTVILSIILGATACHGFPETSMWTISEGEDCVIEFLSEDILSCGSRCFSFAAVGRPDEIFVSHSNAENLSGLRENKIIFPPDSKVYVLNLKTRKVSQMATARFVQLEFIAETLPIGDISNYPMLSYGGDPDGHGSLAPIQRTGKEFIAALSSERKTSEKTTFGLPSIIPFFGRGSWFEKEESHSGTYFLEIFDKENPSKPVVQLQKTFKDHWLLPTVFKMASWAQGTEEPCLVIVDDDYRTSTIKGRILLIRPLGSL